MYNLKLEVDLYGFFSEAWQQYLMLFNLILIKTEIRLRAFI